MKIAFLSNFFNHHQKPLSQKLFALTNGEYRFIATQQMPDERKKLGYSEATPPYVVRSYRADEREEAQRWLDEADVVLSGFVGEELLERRKKNRKLIIRYSERPLKKGFEPWKYPYRWIRFRKLNPRKAQIYLLCSGAYTARDYSLFGLFKNKAYRWGYFPEYRTYEDIGGVIREKDPKEILWCGRFLDWKHPDDALKAAVRLRDEGLDFRMSFIGGGEMDGTLKAYCDAHDLGEIVTFYGSMPPDRVRERMEKAGIFLLTSDKKEGWGAVLNEAMNSACAVVAAREAGAVPYLLDHNVNGIRYCCGDIEALTAAVRMLLQNDEEREKLSKAAYRTIVGEWNADAAAERLVQLCKHLLKNEEVGSLYASGPCSRAGILSEKTVDC